MSHITTVPARRRTFMKRRQLKLDIDPIDGVVPVSKAAATLSELIRQVRQQRQPVLVTHQGYGVAVILDAETFKEMKELIDQAFDREPEHDT